jgi:flagellar hook protein FlgE
MGLASALSTALTGLTGAETSIDVVGNNLANSSTVGYKESSVSFATQFSQTYGTGSSPTTTSGGTNPMQVGLGTMVSAITANFAQGTVSYTSTNTDMAIQGNGFFIIQESDGSYAYTRDGEFTLNAQNQLVTASGNRVLGYTVDKDFIIQTTSLDPITIPLGTKMVAQATQNVTLTGSLTPTGDIADTAQVINTDTLSDGSISMPGATTAAATGSGVLSGDYQYYITYYNSSTDKYSNAVPITDGSGSTTITTSNNQVQITLPTTTSGDWDSWAIYRNTQSDKSTFYQVDTVAFTAGATYTDDATDMSITTNPTLNMIGSGAQITSTTLLTDVVRYNSATGAFDNVFTTGTLDVAQTKGSANLNNTFTIGSTSTVADLLTFFNQSLGIQSGSGIPNSKNDADPSTPYTPGAQIINGKITIVGNNGVSNDVSVSSMTLTSGGTPESVTMPFSTVQEGVGEGAAVGFQVYDSLGIACDVTVTAVLESIDSSAKTTTYRWFADSTSNQTTGSAQVAVGTGLITFDSNGNVVSVVPDTISIDRDNVASTTPLVIALDFSSVSGLAADSSSFTGSTQDGCYPGTLTSYTIGGDGLITGVFSNSAQRTLGQIRLANFNNPNGLVQIGDNLYTAGVNSGSPMYGNPGEKGLGSVTSGAVELSNADVGNNLIDLILASTMYRANTKVITTVQTLFDNLLQLQR